MSDLSVFDDECETPTGRDLSDHGAFLDDPDGVQLHVAIRKIEREARELPYIPAFDLRTDLPRVLDAVDHLLSVHNCDHMGYEEIMGSRDRLREWLTKT